MGLWNIIKTLDTGDPHSDLMLEAVVRVLYSRNAFLGHRSWRFHRLIPHNQYGTFRILSTAPRSFPCKRTWKKQEFGEPRPQADGTAHGNKQTSMYI